MKNDSTSDYATSRLSPWKISCYSYLKLALLSLAHRLCMTHCSLTFECQHLHSPCLSCFITLAFSLLLELTSLFPHQNLCVSGFCCLVYSHPSFLLQAPLSVMCVHVCVLSRVFSAAPWIVAHQASLSMVFFRHGSWSGLPSSSMASYQPRDQTHISCISCIAGRFFPTEPLRKPPWQSHLSPNTCL